MKIHLYDVPHAPADTKPHWMVLGIFPTNDSPSIVEGMGPQQWDWFNYTSGAHEHWDLWCPAISIEGRAAGNELVHMVVNRLVYGLLHDGIHFGDDVVVPFGVPDGDDVDCVFWIGYPQPNQPDSRIQTYRSGAPQIVPVLWSSGLGWG